MTAQFTYCIDTPVNGRMIDTPAFLLSGWIATKKPGSISGLLLKSTLREYVLNRVERPDVIRAHKDHNVAGFNLPLSVIVVGNETGFEIHFSIDGNPCTIPVTFCISQRVTGTAKKIKEKKLEKISPYLECPSCHKGSFAQRDGQLFCNNCHESFSNDGLHIDFLSYAQDPAQEQRSPDAISSNNYDQIVLDLIERNKDGLILDNGAGFRHSWYENVINFEISENPSTDVMGTGESLPFKNDTFDAVLSLAVLEHVKNPFTCAEEIIRVLKPGGTLIAAVPFLQPYHGYPDHYYNMTGEGLANLFNEKITIKDCFVPQSGLPIWCLTWFLQEYVDGLPEPVASRFKKMKIEDLLKNPRHFLEKPLVTELDLRTNKILACTNYLVGQKK
jgi:SAM-dependent methyltransferase